MKKNIFWVGAGIAALSIEKMVKQNSFLKRDEWIDVLDVSGAPRDGLSDSLDVDGFEHD